LDYRTEALIIKTMKNTTYNIILLICRCILHSFDSAVILKKVFKKINTMIKNNGTLFTVKYMKQSKLHITRYMVGKPIKVSPLRITLDREGFPTLFSELKPLIKGTISQRKLVMTFLNITRTIDPKKGEDIPIDLTTITNPFTGTRKLLDSVEIDSAIARLDLKVNLPE